jgi:hypothetical protein
MTGAFCARLPDGRLHLQHGPIDVLIECWGEHKEVEAAYRQACARFGTILGELVEDLMLLRQRVTDGAPTFRGTVANRMLAAVWPHRAAFITPMAAVAGSVADELMEALLRGRSLRKACVNDRGPSSMPRSAFKRMNRREEWPPPDGEAVRNRSALPTRSPFSPAPLRRQMPPRRSWQTRSTSTIQRFAVGRHAK